MKRPSDSGSTPQATQATIECRFRVSNSLVAIEVLHKLALGASAEMHFDGGLMRARGDRLIDARLRVHGIVHLAGEDALDAFLAAHRSSPLVATVYVFTRPPTAWTAVMDLPLEHVLLSAAVAADHAGA